ncbi:hypothetical protein EVAR_41313_1 [Eumeta japonica]|uniref:Uncharacterized protein n=1 Tax=Eumeta variegata TaxID=151549 RepID=A0A4C1X2S2_EUMVA|nr:hypothetical protein EVAR_41313_1 [Eumeta japonica]
MSARTEPRSKTSPSIIFFIEFSSLCELRGLWIGELRDPPELSALAHCGLGTAGCESSSEMLKLFANNIIRPTPPLAISRDSRGAALGRR